MDDQMGHADGSVQARYSHVTADMVGQLLDGLTAAWSAAIATRPISARMSAAGYMCSTRASDHWKPSLVMASPNVPSRRGSTAVLAAIPEIGVSAGGVMSLPATISPDLPATFGGPGLLLFRAVRRAGIDDDAAKQRRRRLAGGQALVRRRERPAKRAALKTYRKFSRDGVIVIVDSG